MAAIQKRGDGNQEMKWMDLGYALEVKSTGLANGLGVESEGKKVKTDSQIFG